MTHIPRVGWGTLAARHYCHFTGRQIRLSLLSTATQSQSPTGRSRFSDRWDYADSSPALHDGAGGSFLGDWGSAATEPLFFSQAWELSASWRIGRVRGRQPPIPPSPHCRPSPRPWLFAARVFDFSRLRPTLLDRRTPKASPLRLPKSRLMAIAPRTLTSPRQGLGVWRAGSGVGIGSTAFMGLARAVPARGNVQPLPSPGTLHDHRPTVRQHSQPTSWLQYTWATV